MVLLSAIIESIISLVSGVLARSPARVPKYAGRVFSWPVSVSVSWEGGGVVSPLSLVFCLVGIAVVGASPNFVQF